ncbi:MAG: hypothetical protein ACP5O0_02610 [Acidimicrobiales bacterium]
MSDLDRNLVGFRELRLPDAKAEYLRQLRDPASYELSFDERLCALFDAEFAARSTRRTKRRIHQRWLWLFASFIINFPALTKSRSTSCPSGGRY